ncbi:MULTISPECIES: spermidine synthase [Shewanella]|uniref:Fused MFS/spermidine synthase n=1 Tax=Shewanella fidelis TaxID=173509 RepID=A0AAW8NQJ8_9GAMM|nr:MULTISPECIES: fused MFS/spermidine synthase [Shewanella]MDR8525085.1 fused MFS/spermidine synthase [Shewanella fidelis]MDW4811156.1 fused MFS/spermidine synthase [Shewanella fidelis]MDW4815065.1 fused MFS/spermidine synthase [Shewanella fidelis]MDW4819155.1 fused MFS/spermidine synthase [Shewanella fidelis]MDW4823167.1 fused MFS/spermidine synthase [Shewanella fidelis]
MSDYQVLHQTQDEYGPLIVLEDKQTRILAFGENDEQSKLLKATPHIPQHTYVQAMLLVLLYSQPKSAIVLGLGGGGLIHALRHFDAGIKLTAVELRAEVIELAKRYFQLPLSKKLKVVHQDAKHFLAAAEHKRVDVVFTDIYSADGVDAAQVSETFIAQCAALIKADGYLVLNCWKEHSQNRELLGYLNMHFAEVRACLTGSGNWVVLAGKAKHEISASGLKSKAQALSQQLDFQLGRSLTRFDIWE